MRKSDCVEGQGAVFPSDILDRPLETVQEVANGLAPEFLVTGHRYDPNSNRVLTILPEGNATASVFDERDRVG